MAKMPVLFMGHGSPMNIVEKNRFTRCWKEVADSIAVPAAILCVSAHWFQRGLAVSGTDQPETIYDFYGFPPELYQIKYPAPGAPQLAEKIRQLQPGTIIIDQDRGLDHGTWSLLHFMYPEAEIPVCQLSVNASFSPQESYRAGKLLSPLREEGVLIIGSGNVVHNLAEVDWEKTGGYDWADEFDDFIKKAVTEGSHDDVIHYEKAGPSAKVAFYGRDHYEPLLFALGATESGETVRVFNDERVMGSLSMTSYLIGESIGKPEHR